MSRKKSKKGIFSGSKTALSNFTQTIGLLYLHHILKQKETSLLYRFVMAQLTQPSHNDWVSQVFKDLEDLSIELEMEEIKSMKETFFSIK